MNFKIIPFILLLAVSSLGFSQDCFDSIIDKKIEGDIDISEEQIIQNIKCFVGHGIDSTDLKIILYTNQYNDNLIASVITELLEEKEESVTYRMIHERLMNLMNDQHYQEGKESLSSVIDFFNLPADLANWEKDKLLLQKAGASENDLLEFYDYLKLHADPTITYNVVFEGFSEQMANESALDQDFDLDLFAHFYEFDFDDILTESIDEAIPIIFYFTNANCSECRTLEEEIYTDDYLYSRLAVEYIFVVLYTDDTTPIDEEKQFYSNELKTKITTEGQLAAHFQLTQFKRTDAPYFVGINSEKRTLAEFTSPLNADSFAYFLDQVNSTFFQHEMEKK